MNYSNEKFIFLFVQRIIIVCMKKILLVFLWLAAVLPCFAETYVAVVETVAENKAIDGAECRFVTDKLREQAKKVLPSYMGYVIMTRANIQQMLPPGKKIEDCEGECLVETGKNINAHYIAQARVVKIGKNLGLTVELYDTKTNNLVSSFTARKPDVDALLDVVEQQAESMFSAIVNGGNFGMVSSAGDVEPREPMTQNKSSESSLSPVSLSYSGDVYKTFTDTRDGHVYRMVTIGTQTWMAENLDFATNSSRCFKAISGSGFEDCGKKGFGRYYTWPDAMDSVGRFSKGGLGCGHLPNYQATKCAAVQSKKKVRGICPQGWHLPDTTEWNTLLKTVGNPPVGLVKRELKNFKGATDAYGFSAIPTGSWFLNDCYECYEGLLAQRISFWTSTPHVYDKSIGLNHFIFDFSGSSSSEHWSPIDYYGRSSTHASYAIPVRCLKD